MRDFVNRYSLEHIPHAQDLDGRIWERFGVFGQPAWYFIEDDGSTSRNIGSMSSSEIHDVLDLMVSR